MYKEAIGTGQTVEEAKEDAVAKLGLKADEEFEFEIIDLPHKKTLGIFGGSPAKVRVYTGTPEEAEKPAKPAKPEKAAPARKDTQTKPAKPAVKEEKAAHPEKAAVKEEKSAHSEEKAAAAEKIPSDDKTVVYLDSVLKNMGIENYSIDASLQDGIMTLELSGDNMGVAIGRRGETLDAIQYLCSIIANQGSDDFVRVVVDTGNYREKRAEALRTLARNMAAKAKRTGRNQMLEPMNPYERRIIHTVVQDIDGMSSWSVGDGMGRRVIIGRSRRGDGAHRRQPYGRSSSRPRSARPQEKQEQPERDDLGSAPLYGRIDNKQ